jgi:hypothetical protein
VITADRAKFEAAGKAWIPPESPSENILDFKPPNIYSYITSLDKSLGSDKTLRMGYIEGERDKD